MARRCPSYDEEIGHDSSTETFVAIKAHIDNWRWKGVPFYLRTGKRMPVRKSQIFIQFRDVPFSIFASRGATDQAQQAGHRAPAGENRSA